MNTKIKGIRNEGNTCFFNASMQILLRITPLVRYLQQNESISELSTTMAKWIHDYMSNQTVEGTRKIRKAMGEFNDYRQHDSQEALLRILDKLEDNDKSFKKILKQYVDIEMRTVIKSIPGTGGQYESVASNLERFLSIPTTKTLNESYRALNKSEIIQEYVDDESNTRCDITKQFMVGEWPEYLLVHIKQYDHFMRKIDERGRTTPFIWNINHKVPYMKKKRTSNGNTKYIHTPHNIAQNIVYTVVSAIVHRGSLNGGHYYAVHHCPKFDNFDNCDVNQSEFKIANDATVSDINYHNFQNDLNQAYVVLYKKSDSSRH